MAEMNSSKCSHCGGTGICNQSSLADTKNYENDDLTAVDSPRIWKKTICKICDETSESHTNGKIDIDTFRHKPNQLTCKVCGGSGYIGELPYLTKSNSKKNHPNNLNLKD